MNRTINKICTRHADTAPERSDDEDHGAYNTVSSRNKGKALHRTSQSYAALRTVQCRGLGFARRAVDTGSAEDTSVQVRT